MNKAHFATYPPDLIRPCILAGCPKGGTVLDPFIGSGTTAYVAKQEGRDYVGIEIQPEYEALISDCEAGKIDVVLTKSISRFARNTVDLLSTVRHLKELGVEVRFEKENINSLSGDGELMMTIIASIAQEEVRSTSENIKWGIRKDYANGVDVARNKKVYGYRYDGEKYVVQEDEAEIVRYIFSSAAAGIAPSIILKELKARGAKTWRGYDFSFGCLETLLKNEIYIGDRRMQKTFVADPLKQNKIKNRGELPQYYISECHEPIIDRETFDKVQEIMRQRAEAVPVYPFTGKIKCGTCGHTFTRKKQTLKGKDYYHWICRSKKEAGTTCSSVNYTEAELEKISARMIRDYRYSVDKSNGDKHGGNSSAGVQFDSAAFESAVRLITVEKNGDLRYQFADGSERVWKNLHLHQLKHEFTVTDCFQGKIVCGCCGNTYHRVVSTDRWVYWYCIGKKRKDVDCHSVNYADFQLRRISAAMLGLTAFKEAVFEKAIDKIVVLDDGSLEYHFYDGRIETWERI